MAGRILNMSPDDFFAEHEYPAPGCSEIHMIWSRGDTYLNMPNRNRDLQVYQHKSIETIVCQDPFFNRDARYADIVLPVTTNFEREDLTEPSFVGTYMPLAVINNRCAVFHRRCIDPVGESKDDYAIMSELARRLGFEERYTEGNTVDSWLRKMYAKSNVPLTFDELKERGYYAWQATPDYQPCKQLELFYQDPREQPAGDSHRKAGDFLHAAVQVTTAPTTRKSRRSRITSPSGKAGIPKAWSIISRSNSSPHIPSSASTASSTTSTSRGKSIK